MRTILSIALLFLYMETKANTLNLLICGDTTDSSEIIRNASIRDIQDFSLLAKKVAASIGYRVNIIKFSNKTPKDAKPFTVSSLVKEIQNLPTSKTDICWLVVHSHGGSSNDNSDQFPRIFTGVNNHESIKLSTLKALLKRKGGRLNLVMSHCCNGSKGEHRNNIKYSKRENFETINFDRLRPLFLGLKGDIMICSSKKEYLSWSYPNGGISFTYMLNNMVKMAKGEINNVSWNHLINITCTEVADDFGSSPYYEITLNNLVKVIPHTEITSRISKNTEKMDLHHNILFKTNENNHLYIQNLSNEIILVMVVCFDKNEQLTASRVHKIPPKKKVYLRNPNFSAVRHYQGNFYSFLKSIKRNDPHYHIDWKGGNSVKVNGKHTPMKIMSLQKKESE